MIKSLATTPIPVQLSGPEFIAFIFPYLSMPMRGPKCKLGYHRVFNLILWVLYTAMQWKCMPVPRASDGTALIHYTTIYKVFAKWADDGSLDQAFIASVRHLAEQHHLDLKILHGDGTNTVAKKGGDGIGYSEIRHKHQTGEKIIAIVDNNGFVPAPLPVAPVNETDTVLLPQGLNILKRVARLTDLKIDGSSIRSIQSSLIVWVINSASPVPRTTGETRVPRQTVSGPTVICFAAFRLRTRIFSSYANGHAWPRNCNRNEFGSATASIISSGGITRRCSS